MPSIRRVVVLHLKMKNKIFGFTLVAAAAVSGCAVLSVSMDLKNALQASIAGIEALQDGHCVEGLSLFEQANEKISEAVIAAMKLERKSENRKPFDSEEIKKLRAGFKSGIEAKGMFSAGGQQSTGSLLYVARCYSELGQLDKAKKAYESFLKIQSVESVTRMMLWAIDSIGEDSSKSIRSFMAPELSKKDWLNIANLPEKMDKETLFMALSVIKSPELFRKINLDTAIRYANFTPEQEKIAWSVFNQKPSGQDIESLLRMYRIKIAQLMELAKVSPRFSNAMKTPAANLFEMEAGQLFIDYTLQDDQLIVSALQDQDFVVLKRATVPKLKARILAYRLLMANPTLASLEKAREDIFDVSTQMTAWQENGYLWIDSQRNKPISTKSISEEMYLMVRNEAIRQHENWLRDHLLGDFEGIIKTPQFILIAPDSVLATIPWSNLLQSSDRMRGVPFSLVHSMGIYQQIKQRQAELKKLYPTPDSGRRLVVADPSYDLKNGSAHRNSTVLEAMQTEQPPPNKTYANAYDRMQKIKWINLPGAKAEGKEIQKILRGELLSGVEATEENITANFKSFGQNTRYLHFATHGYFDPAFPIYSSIVLGRTGNTFANDGYLTAWEIPSMTLQTELVVLSACETGISVGENSDGILGIPYALFLAGASETIVTLWPIDDIATQVFMNKFWKQKLSGVSAAKALLNTQMAFKRGESGNIYRDPVYWGAFMLYGGVGS